MTHQYQLGDYVRIHDHDGAEITVKITDSGIPNRQGDFTFKAGARMFKNSEILGLGDVPVVSEKKFEEKRLFNIGDQVVIDRKSRAAIVGRDERSAIFPYRVQYFGGHKDWIEVHRIKHFIPELPTPAPDTEVHEDLGREQSSISSTGGEKNVKPEKFSLIPVEALAKVAEHYGVGAKKYSAHQWRKGYEWSKSYDALQRHATAFWSGEDNDFETGTPHMAAVAFHALTLLTFMDEQPAHDDRYRSETK